MVALEFFNIFLKIGMFIFLNLKKVWVKGKNYYERRFKQPKNFPVWELIMKNLKVKFKELAVPVTIVSSYCLTMLPLGVLAEDSAPQTPDLKGSFWDIANSILGTIQSIALPIAAILVIFFGVQILVANDARSLEEAKKNALRSFIGLLIILFVPIIIKTIGESFFAKRYTSFNDIKDKF